MQVITEQRSCEHLYLLHTKANGQDASHYILVPYDKMSIIKKYEKGENIDVENCYRIIEYRDENGRVRPASIYGREPPENLTTWINQQYGPAAIDRNTAVVYTEDEIRLCTIQRSHLEHLIGLSYRLHNFEHFYYVDSLSDESKSTLALCAGIKLFDRIIECNGVNIEGDSEEDLSIRIEKLNVLTIQLLVCNPATYNYYKSKNKHIHSNLPTVKYMKPVNDKNAGALGAGNKQIQSGDYCAVRWEDNTGVSVVQNSAVRKPPNTIQIFEQRVVERDGCCRNGQIILKGSKSDCEILRHTIQKVNLNTYAMANHKVDYKSKSHIPPHTHHDTSKEDRDDIHHVPCDGCQSRRIQDDRYRCLQCLDFDLCGECFEKRFEKDQHRSGHIYVHLKTPNELFGETIININKEINLTNMKKRFASVKHTNYRCDGCGIKSIVGIRLKCDICPNYNLCLTCVEQQKITLQHKINHPLILVDKNSLPKIDINDIKHGPILGRGGFGTVHKSKWLSKNRQVACKVLTVPPDRKDLYKSFVQELSAYNELSGAYILKLYGYACEQSVKYGVQEFTLVMEYMGQGSLTNVIQANKISLWQKLEMAWHIAVGMKKIHARQMVHRDIRPDNILVNDFYTAKIGDMGIARSMTGIGEENLTLIGCLSYMPPEFTTGKYNQSLDVFTFGLTLYHLFTGTQHSFNPFLRKINLPLESPIFNELIQFCTDNRPGRRPSAAEIETALNLYRRPVDKLIRTEYPKYEEYSTDHKNEIFMKFYETLHSQITDKMTHQLSKYSSTLDNEEGTEYFLPNLAVILQWLMQVPEDL